MSRSTTRNQAYAALFDLTANLRLPSGTPALVARSRKLKHFSKVSSDQQPVLYQTEHTETEKQGERLPPFRKWQGHWTLYISSEPSDESQIGSVWLNDYLDALDFAIRPPFGQSMQTLGGLVHHAFIDGTILKVPGDDDGQGLMTVPFTMLVP